MRESLSAAQRTYAVKVAFYPADECAAAYGVSRSAVGRAVGGRFGYVLRKEVVVAIKKAVGEAKDQIGGLGKGRAVRDALDGAGGPGADEDAELGEAELARRDDVSEVGDGDADAVKRKTQGEEAATYSDDEDEEGSDAEGEIGEEDIEAAVDADDDEVLVDVKTRKEKKAKKRKAKEAEEWDLPEGLAADFADATKFGSGLEFGKDQCSFELEVSPILFKLDQYSRTIGASFHPPRPNSYSSASWSNACTKLSYTKSPKSPPYTKSRNLTPRPPASFAPNISRRRGRTSPESGRPQRTWWTSTGSRVTTFTRSCVRMEWRWPGRLF